jgi:hypothetical protein
MAVESSITRSRVGGDAGAADELDKLNENGGVQSGLIRCVCSAMDAALGDPRCAPARSPTSNSGDVPTIVSTSTWGAFSVKKDTTDLSARFGMYDKPSERSLGCGLHCDRTSPVSGMLETSRYTRFPLVMHGASWKIRSASLALSGDGKVRSPCRFSSFKSAVTGE